MKLTFKFLVFSLGLIIFSCGSENTGKEERSAIKLKKEKVNKEEPSETKVLVSKIIDLENKGVGPVSSIDVPDEIDDELVYRGKEIFFNMCLTCHRLNKNYIGPPVVGLIEKRTPEWIMNFILDPEGMIRNDSLAKALQVEYKGAPMANQQLTYEDARAVLEYFRTLK